MLVLGLGNFHGEVFKMGKRGDAELEQCCVDVGLVNGEWNVCISMLKIDCIWRNLPMSGNFDSGCFGVMPKNIASGMQQASKEDALPGVGLWFCCSFSWRFDSHTKSKGSKVREILNDIGSFCDW